MRPLDLAAGTRWPSLAHGSGRPVHGSSCSLRKPGRYILGARRIPSCAQNALQSCDDPVFLCTCGLDASWLARVRNNE